MIYSPFDLRKNKVLQHPNVRVLFHKPNQKLEFSIRKEFTAQNKETDIKSLSSIFTSEYPSPEVYTAYVKNVLVSPRPVGLPRYWAMFFDKYYIYNFIGEQAKNVYSLKNVFKIVDKNCIYFDRKSIKPICIPGKSVWLFTFKNVDHLVRECLPALLTLKEAGEDFRLLNFIMPSTNNDTLELLFSLGVPSENILQMDSKWIEFEELILPCFGSLGHLHTPTKYYTDTSILLRNQVLKSSHKIIAPQRIYVSRKNAKMRRLLNEDVLHSGLLKRGFTIIEPGEYSKKHQVILFSKAEIIVGQHGMGIANAAFSQNLKLIFEIMSTTYNRISYFRTAQLLNCDYATYYVEPEDRKYALPTDPSGDILVDPAVFFKFLDSQISESIKVEEKN